LTYELIIDSGKDGLSIALLRDKRLVEYHVEANNKMHTVGDIYLGMVKRVMPGHNAAFVDVGHDKDAFLHYLDLGPQVRSLLKFSDQATRGAYPTADLANFKLEADIEKTGKMGQVITRGRMMLVQVAKEPISTKGPRLTSELSLPGTYMVMVPFSNVVSVSKKIKTNEERLRLKKLVESIKPKNFGIIIRTVAEGKTVEELHKDLKELQQKWQNMYDQVKLSRPPKKIHGESDRSISLIRDLLSEDFSQIVVNDEFVADEIKGYLKNLGRTDEKIVKLHHGKQSIFEYFEIDKKIKSAFGKNVPIGGGSYLVIEHTEALHVIDVNSGSKSNSEINQEDNALQVNLEAAAEIARQLRLRDMGGIIVCDFIDQRNPANKRKIYERLREEMERDRAKHTILPMSRFGLIEITRQRVRPEINIEVLESCPQCNGTGEVRSSLLMMDQIEKNLAHFATEMNMKKLTIVTHPYLAAFLTKGWFRSPRWKWYRKYKTWLTVEGDNHFTLSQFRFANSQGEEMEL
jgi:ribonuclease G